MEYIFHEKQEGSLCAQHCLNALLQGAYFTAVDLATLAQQMDEAERLRMAEGGVHSEEYRRFLEQPSSNMDDSGFFSIQVIASALKVWNLELVPFNSLHPTAVAAHHDPMHQIAFICNYREHWFTIRKLGKQWFNLNSLLTGPELISDTYLEMFLKQLQWEGYSIFIVLGLLPECDADDHLKLKLAVQEIKPRLIADTKTEDDSRRTYAGQSKNGYDDEETQLDAALRLSLQEYNANSPSASHFTGETSSKNTEQRLRQTEDILPETFRSSLSTPNSTCLTPNKLSSDELSEEAMLEAALKMSMEQEK